VSKSLCKFSVKVLDTVGSQVLETIGSRGLRKGGARVH
jgi:hypothetical protein